LGDAIHAILCGAGHNIRLLLRWLRLFYALMLVWLADGLNEKHAMAA
ncbi:MAG: IS5/IS1182 family transposase, partial [Alcaligenaceae bacterium]|nr:IS5/IS1182 family transposase [Alcaligenaceae bacterium]